MNNQFEQNRVEESHIFASIRARKYKSMNIITTVACNYACDMCPYHGSGYNGEYFKERPSIRRNMKLDELRTILQKAKDAGIEQIDLTPNGEFFLHKEWRKILETIKEFGLRIYLTSNGGLLNEEQIKEICKIGIDHVVISIDSLNYERYRIIRKPATFEAYVNAINSPIYFKRYGQSAYVQVQVTEQPEFMPNNDVQEILDFYKDANLNQITVNKMFQADEAGMSHHGATRGEYVHGTCKGYGNPIVLTDGRVIPCCGGFYFYPRIENKFPNVLTDISLQDAMKQIDDLYQYNEIFRNYCLNCSLYDANSTDAEHKFIFENYYAEQTRITTRYFLLPSYLRKLPKSLVLWLYKKGYVRILKRFFSRFGIY
ncbi:MAG: radical SAM protein [Wolinella sp.]